MELTSVVDTVHRKCLLGVQLPHGFPFYAWNAALTGYEPTYAFSAFPLYDVIPLPILILCLSWRATRPSYFQLLLV
eukprot:scaffold74109_cov33-Attheya_sp.AAC.1